MGTVQNPQVHRSVRPPILSVFGDVALAIGVEFKKYLVYVLNILDQAGRAQIDHSNPDLVDYLAELRDACLEAYSGIFQGMKAPGPSLATDLQGLAPLQNHLPLVVAFIEAVSTDADRAASNVVSALGVLGSLPPPSSSSASPRFPHCFSFSFFYLVTSVLFITFNPTSLPNIIRIM